MNRIQMLARDGFVLKKRPTSRNFISGVKQYRQFVDRQQVTLSVQKVDRFLGAVISRFHLIMSANSWLFSRYFFFTVFFFQQMEYK